MHNIFNYMYDCMWHHIEKRIFIWLGLIFNRLHIFSLSQVVEHYTKYIDIHIICYSKYILNKCYCVFLIRCSSDFFFFFFLSSFLSFFLFLIPVLFPLSISLVRALQCNHTSRSALWICNSQRGIGTEKKKYVWG